MRTSQAAHLFPGNVGGYAPLPTGLEHPRAAAGAVFDRVADLYDRARPGYPAAAISDLVRICGVTPATRILEIGCGTGQLTGELATIGSPIVAIELGASLAALARTNLAGYSNVEVIQARFEDLIALPGSFDLVVAASAFHWIDPTVAYDKAAALLRPRSFLALVTHLHAAGGSHAADPFAHHVRLLHRRLAPQVGDWTFPAAEDLASRAKAGGDIATVWTRFERKWTEPRDVSDHLFEEPHVKIYPWMATYERDTYLDMLASQSGYALLEPEPRTALLEGIGRLVDEHLDGQITKEYVSVVATARRHHDAD